MLSTIPSSPERVSQKPYALLPKCLRAEILLQKPFDNKLVNAGGVTWDRSELEFVVGEFDSFRKEFKFWINFNSQQLCKSHGIPRKN